MGAAYGKKKAYSIHHQPPPKQQANGRPPNRTSASADRQQQPGGRGPSSRGPGGRGPAPLAVPVPAPDYEDADQDLIRPKKLLNPVKASRSHQELHRELLSSCKRDALETKPELQRVLEARRRDQLIRQRKQEEEARKKVCPLEAELLKRQRKLEELEQLEQMDEQQPGAPEFIRVREKLRRTSLLCKEEEEL